jgi:hypothetical protein
MEWWILSGFAVIVIGIGIVVRVRKSQHRQPEGEAKNVYPLW